MYILKYIVGNLSFRIDMGEFAIVFPFFMIGFLFLSVIYLTLRLWISDIILKFLIECFGKDKIEMKDYSKKDKNRMNRYISIALMIELIVPAIMSDFLLNDNYFNEIVYYIVQIGVVMVTTGLIYINIKKLIK